MEKASLSWDLAAGMLEVARTRLKTPQKKDPPQATMSVLGLVRRQDLFPAMFLQKWKGCGVVLRAKAVREATPSRQEQQASAWMAQIKVTQPDDDDRTLILPCGMFAMNGPILGAATPKRLPVNRGDEI